MTQELMIGNWVMFRGDKLAIVVSLDEFEIEIDGEGFRRKIPLNEFNDLSPIPFTPEWLEYLGFKKDLAMKNMYVRGMIECVINPTTGKYRVMFNLNTINVFYVHQIQNLITILNGKKSKQLQKMRQLEFEHPQTRRNHDPMYISPKHEFVHHDELIPNSKIESVKATSLVQKLTEVTGVNAALKAIKKYFKHK